MPLMVRGIWPGPAVVPSTQVKLAGDSPNALGPEVEFEELLFGTVENKQ